jgi:cytochrome P450
MPCVATALPGFDEHGGSNVNVTGNEAGVAGYPYLADYQPMSQLELNDPNPTYAWARENAPVFYSDISHTPGKGIWSISRNEDVLAALRDTETFSSAGQRSPATPPESVRHRMPEYPWSTTVLTQDGVRHKESRRILQAPFTPQSVRALEDVVSGIMGELARQAAHGQSMDFVTDIAFPLSLGTISETLGLPQDRFDDFQRWVAAAFAVIGNALTEESAVEQAIEEVTEFYEFMVELVQDRISNPREDYLSAMVRSTADEDADARTTTLVRSVFTLIVAGFETTAQAMSLGLWQLLSHPDQWQMLLRDRALVPGAVEEMLRYRSMIQRLFRTTTRDVEVAGVMIPKGSLVALLVASTNRDSAAYPDADTFDITRRSNTHLAFGRGAHFCVGAPLAKLEAKLMLQTMLDTFPTLRLADDFRPEFLPDIRMAILRRLPLVWD